jgi:signal transduction histidine kinase
MNGSENEGNAGATLSEATPPRSLRVLLVEDSEDDAALLERSLQKAGYEIVCRRVETAETFAAELREHPWDLILADYKLPRFSAPAALQKLQESALDLPFLIVSGTIGEEAAVAAMRSGAHDYILKDNLARLVPAIEREMREARVRGERRRVEAQRREDAVVSAALARISRELIAVLGTPALLGRLCQLTAEVLTCDSSSTLLADPQDDTFTPIALFGVSDEEREIARLVRVPRELMTSLIERLERDEVAEVRDIPAMTVLNEEQRRGVQLCTALRRGTELFGIQVASRCDPDSAFSPTEKRIARGIAHLASLSLEQATVIEELERANRVKSECVATISHELRTPLNVMMGYTDLLLEGCFGPISAEQSETLGRVSARARGLFDLINATLDLSRLEAGEITVDAGPLDVEALFAELEAESKDLRGKPGVEVLWEREADLPLLVTDSAKLEVALKNLVGNAVKFTERGSVRVAVRGQRGGLEFVVADTGIGIAPEAIPIIFDAFRQGDSSNTRRYGGVGLGLYIVRRLVGLLGGTISVDSRVGHGSTFRIWLPDAAPAPQ